MGAEGRPRCSVIEITHQQTESARCECCVRVLCPALPRGSKAASLDSGFYPPAPTPRLTAPDSVDGCACSLLMLS